MRSAHVFGCMLLVATATANAATSYRYIDLGTFGGNSSEAFAINNSGHVVGWAESVSPGQVYSYDWWSGAWSVSPGNVSTRNAFVYDRGQMINLGIPGEESAAHAINDNNRIVGSVGGAMNTMRAFRLKYGPFNETGNLTSFVDPAIQGNWATAINNRNETVVNSAYSGQTKFVYRNNTATNMGPLLGSPSWQRAINNSGIVVGESFLNANSTGAIHATAYNSSTGEVTDLGTLAKNPTSTNTGGVAYPNHSWAWDINDSGQIVGSSYTDKVLEYAAQHAYLYENGAMVDLGVLPGTTESTAFAINNHGTIVGRSGWHGFIYTDGAMYDLNAIADVPDGWTIHMARDINDHGQIVGYSILDSSYGGITHAFLLDPISSGAGLMLSPDTPLAETYQSVYLPYAGTFSPSYVSTPQFEPAVPEPTLLAPVWIASALILRRKRPA